MTQTPSFEEQLLQLEATISQLEDPNLSLTQAIKAFEKGQSILQQCQLNLSEAQSKVQILIKDSDSFALEDFEQDEN